MKELSKGSRPFRVIFAFAAAAVLLVTGAAVHCRTQVPALSKTAVAASDTLAGSIYYWRTTFNLSPWERQFLADNRVGRLYLRYFDVTYNGDDAVPQATLLFRDPVPEGVEIIPTVFIDVEVFRRGNMIPMAEKLVTRILTMSATNDVPGVREVQIDCDWTGKTREAFFTFMAEVRRLLAARGIALSATIRLHQLASEAPPADRGVLMCYNTGAVRSSETHNSILASSDVALYARKMKDYGLHLDVAYPAFDWAVWLQGGEFRALLRGLEPTNPNLEYEMGNVYRVREGFYWGSHYLYYGDRVRFEHSDFDQIMQAKELLADRLPAHNVVLYHLDSAKLSKFTPDEIARIYGR